MTEPTELLPCPFCEGRARMKTVASDWWKIVIDHTEGCVLSGHYDDAIVPQDDESKDWLIDRWNTRAKWGTPAPVVAGDVTKLVQGAQAFVLEPTSLQKKLHLEAQAWGPLAGTPQPTQPQAGAVPLPDEQIEAAVEAWFANAKQHDFHGRMRSAINAAHGIKGGQHGPI